MTKVFSVATIQCNHCTGEKVEVRLTTYDNGKTVAACPLKHMAKNCGYDKAERAPKSGVIKRIKRILLDMYA